MDVLDHALLVLGVEEIQTETQYRRNIKELANVYHGINSVVRSKGHSKEIVSFQEKMQEQVKSNSKGLG